MKPIKILLTTVFMLTFWGCKKNSVNPEVILIPNGDFELWDNMPILSKWQTNSCPACVPPYDTYIVKRVTDAHSGQFATKFIYNNVYSSFAINKFAISIHPTVLTGYIKSNIATGDTAMIHVDLTSGNNIVDNGNFYELSSTTSYKKIEIHISQSSLTVDSAIIKIVGGKKQTTEFYVDNLVFLKSN